MDFTATEQKIRGKEGLLHIDDGGQGGVPILFAHSFAGSTAHWEKALKHFRKTQRAIAFDFRGHGQSEIPTHKNVFDIEQLVDDIAIVANDLNLDKFILVGHSMGGAVSAAYAGKYPERLAGLVIAGVPAKLPKEQSAPILKSLRSDAYQKVMDEYVKGQLMGANPATASLMKPSYRKIDEESTINSVEALFNNDPLKALKKYSGPMLIVATANEEKQAVTLHKQEPGIPFKIIDESSHWAMLDQPEEFIRILDEFVGSVNE